MLAQEATPGQYLPTRIIKKPAFAGFDFLYGFRRSYSDRVDIDGENIMFSQDKTGEILLRRGKFLYSIARGVGYCQYC